jgi:hypothetical protein
VLVYQPPPKKRTYVSGRVPAIFSDEGKISSRKKTSRHCPYNKKIFQTLIAIFPINSES